MEQATTRLHILLAEDNPDHAFLAKRALRQAHPDLRDDMTVFVAADGAEALDYLREATPDLLLLDLKMPGVGGLDVLRAMQGDARLSQIPVVVLTTSTSTHDAEAAYRLGASAYLVKPLQPQEFRQKMQRISSYRDRLSPPPSTLSAG